MQTPCRGAPQLQPAEVTGHDAFSCFSQEEWELLQKWQKELYKNVLKEIDQALVSLGPVLATVFSLRAQGKQELLSRDHQESLKGARPHNPDDLHKMNKEEIIHLDNIPETEGREGSECLAEGDGDCPSPVKDEDEAFCVEHIDSSNEESIGSPPGHEIVSFPIKDEEDAYCIYRPESEDRVTRSSGPDMASFHIKDEEEDYCIEHPGSNNGQSISSPTAILPGVSVRGGVTRKKPYACREKKRASHKPTVERPPETYTGEKLFLCDICDKRFSKKSYLQQHQRLHGGPNSIPCMDCGKIFSKPSDLQRHEIIHTGEKPFTCAECGRSFTQMSGLKRHRRLHTGENPFPCTECGKSYTFKSDLQRHQRNHTVENPFP
ncbi:uncharacterized protein LOC144770974 isoform X2 [Lissotriton helveticus]